MNLFLQPYRDVEAQLRTWELDQFIEQAKKIPENGVFVEIGTKYGGSAYIARWHSPETATIASIDPKATLYMFNNMENQVGIDWIKGYSLDIAKEWKKPIDLLFIDGDHGEGTPTAPTDDFFAWEGFVKKGGIIMMHDCHFDFPAVREACDKIMETGRYELLFKPPVIANRQDTLMFIIKKK